MKAKVLFSGFTLLLLGQLVTAASVFSPNHSEVLYTGRWDFSDPTAPWAQAKASSLTVNFQGTGIAIEYSGHSADYLRVIIDDDAASSVKIPLVNGLNVLASGLTDTGHKLELVKERDAGRLVIHGIQLDDDRMLLASPSRPARKIEFYGDSNQAGYSLESERNLGDANLQGAYYTYPGIVARMFSAEHVNFSRSGATISSLNSAFNRTDWSSPSPSWDFSRFAADLVVINIGANDSGRPKRIKDRYHTLLDNLRSAHPGAHIMLYNAYGWSFSEPANFIDEVVAERGDTNMSHATFPWVFAQYHGCETDHGGMAMVLSKHIQTVMGWAPTAQDVMSGFGADGDMANGSFEQVAPFGGWGWRYHDDAGVSRVHAPLGAHHGDHYLRLGLGAQVQQTNPATSNETYTLHAWMRGEPGDLVEMRLDFRDQGKGAGEVSPNVAFSSSKTLTADWTEYTLQATAPGDFAVYATRATFTAGLDSTADIDSVSLTAGLDSPPACIASSIHVASLVTITASAGRGRKYGAVTVGVENNCGDAVDGAQVSGEFSGDFEETVSATTESDGNATLTTIASARKPDYNFCLANVMISTLPYEPQANSDGVAECDSP